jgi:phosphatidate cytidylyltransferase
VNTQEAVEVNLWLGVGGAVLLFLTSFLHAADVIRYPVFSFYGLYIVLTLIAELYLKKKNPIHNWAYLILGQIFIALPFALLNFIAFIDADQFKPLILLAVFVTIWVNDTGAYLFGITFGKHRLFERISPKKSWEGFFGGLFTTALLGYFISPYLTPIEGYPRLWIGALIAAAGFVGDVTISSVKRDIHLKDSGNILPGHGGILDRIDSLCYTAPVFFHTIYYLYY